MPPTLENRLAIIFMGGVMFKSLALCGLVSAGAAVPANASVFGYKEETSYNFVYTAPYASIFINEDFGSGTKTASIYGETSDGFDMVYAGFTLEGIDPISLIGKTIGLGPRQILNAFSGIYAEYVSGIGLLDSSQAGYLTFGADGEVADWKYSGYSLSGGAFNFSTSALPSILNLPTGTNDPNGANGSLVFDAYDFEPNDSSYSTRRGVWTTSIYRSCFITQDGNYYDSTECRLPAAVPLPASYGLLASVIALLSVLGLRKSARPMPLRQV